jgi:hypothetical protein
MTASPQEQLVRCAPQRTGLAVAMIGGVPLLLAAIALGRTWLHNVIFGDEAVVDAQLVLFVVGLLCALWIVPAYWMAISMLSTITVNRAGLRRGGVLGAGLFLPWSETTEIAQHVSVEGEPVLIVKGPGAHHAVSPQSRARRRGDRADRAARRRAWPVDQAAA